MVLDDTGQSISTEEKSKESERNWYNALCIKNISVKGAMVLQMVKLTPGSGWDKLW